MSLYVHTMQNREEKETPPFRSPCEFSKEIAERINNMSLMELRKVIQDAGMERGSLHVCKPNASMPSVDIIAKSDEISMKAISDAMKTVTGWYEMRQEVLHYLSQGVDCFTVSFGPWTIEYDNRKESEIAK